MANEEHVKRLKQGVAEWNAWRGTDGDTLADLRDANLMATNLRDADLSGAILSGAILSGAILIGANLTGANLDDAILDDANLRDADLSGANLRHAALIGAALIGANLSGADLSDAYLTGANLRHADLSGANLSGANLRTADLTGADLRDAKLRDADLQYSNLTLARLSRADLTNAELSGTGFGYVDLANTIGLETCVHRGASIIGYQTLQISGRLPLPFLRGVGLPNQFIDYLPSLLEEAIQYYSCFISYSHKDEDLAQRIHAELQNMGVRCWYAPLDLPIGGKLLDEIDTAIRIREKVVLLLSKHSIDSEWVEEEVLRAFAEERKRGQTVLFPILLDDAVMHTTKAWAVKLRDQRNIGDFRHWKDHDGYKRSFERVLRDLKRAAE